jgi:hypothetical protein
MKKILISLSICFLIISGFCFGSEAGAVDPGQFPGVGKASPIVKSKFFILTAPVKNGTAQVQLPLDNTTKGIALVLGEYSVKAIGADQQALEPQPLQDKENSRMNMPSTNTRFNLDSLSAGLQSLTLLEIKDSRYVRMVISQPESSLQLEVQVRPLAARSGERVTVTAGIDDEDLPQEAIVTAVLPDGTSIKLNDNGLDGDPAADDGIYSGTFTAPVINDFQGINIRFTAAGKRFNGLAFQRNAINTVMVTQPRCSILKDKIAVNPNGILVPLAAANGNYRVEIIFGIEEISLAYSRENITLRGNTAAASLPLPQQALAANRALIRLLNKDTLGLEDEIEIHLTPTKAAPDFESLTLSKQAPTMPDSKKQAAEKIKEQDETHSHHKHNH